MNCAEACGAETKEAAESSIVYGIGLALTERISMKDGVVEASPPKATELLRRDE